MKSALLVPLLLVGAAQAHAASTPAALAEAAAALARLPFAVRGAGFAPGRWRRGGGHGGQGGGGGGVSTSTKAGAAAIGTADHNSASTDTLLSCFH